MGHISIPLIIFPEVCNTFPIIYFIYEYLVSQILDLDVCESRYNSLHPLLILIPSFPAENKSVKRLKDKVVPSQNLPRRQHDRDECDVQKEKKTKRAERRSRRAQRTDEQPLETISESVFLYMSFWHSVVIFHPSYDFSFPVIQIY